MSWVSQGRPVPMPAASTQQTGLLELSLLLKLPRAGGLFSLQPRISGCPRYLNFTPGQMRDSQPSSTAGPHGKNLPKTRLPKFVKLTDYIYACICLTTFEFEAQWKTGHGNYLNLLKLPWKTRENTLKANLFLAGFCFLAQLCVCDSELFPLSQSGQLRYSQLNSLNSTGQFSWAQSRRTDIDSGGATAAPVAPAICTVISQIFFSIRNLAAKFGVGLNQGLNT